MIRHIKVIYTALALTCFICCNPQQPTDNKLSVDAIAVPVKNGWGYEIYVDNRLFIKQEYIPAVSGVHQFINEKDALTTAHLVLAKMKEGKKPFITVAELKHAGIDITN